METNIRHRLGPPEPDLRTRLNKSDLRERLSNRRRHRSSQGRETMQLVVSNTGDEGDNERRFTHVPELEEEDPTLLEIRQSIEYDFGPRRSRSRSPSRRRSGDGFDFDLSLSRTVPNEHHHHRSRSDFIDDYEPRRSRHYDDYRDDCERPLHDGHYDRSPRYNERYMDNRYDDRRPQDELHEWRQEDRYREDFRHRRYSADYEPYRSDGHHFEERRHSNENTENMGQSREFRPQMHWRDEGFEDKNEWNTPPSQHHGNPGIRDGFRFNFDLSGSFRDSGIASNAADSEPFIPPLPLPAPVRKTPRKTDHGLEVDLTGIVPIGSSSQTMNNVPMEVSNSDDEVMSIAPKEIAEDPFAKMTTEEIKEKLDDLKECDTRQRNRRRRQRGGAKQNVQGSGRKQTVRSMAFKDFMNKRSDSDLAKEREAKSLQRKANKPATTTSSKQKPSVFNDFMNKKDEKDLARGRESNNQQRQSRKRSPKDTSGKVKSRSGGQQRQPQRVSAEPMKRFPSPHRRSRSRTGRSFSPIRSRSDRQVSPSRSPRNWPSRSPSIEEIPVESEIRRRAPSPPRGIFDNIRPKSLSPRRGPTLKFMGAATPGVCPCCGSEFHQLPDCLRFREKSVDKRWNIVESFANVCSLCLKTGHNHNVCGNYEIKCCNSEIMHHPLLHPGRVVDLDLPEDEQIDDDHLPAIKCSFCNEKQHHAYQCPKLFCHKCKRAGHFPQNCDGKQIKQICQYCKMPGHTISICPIVLCRRCGRQGHTDLTCTNDVVPGQTIVLGRNCFECGGIGHQSNDCPNLRCSKCQGRGHWANQCQEYPMACNNCGVIGHLKRDCPHTECQKCGGSGHWKETCQYLPNQFRAAPAPPRNVVTFNYHHLAASSSTTNNMAEKPSMIRYFSKYLNDKGKPVSLCDEMIHTWRLSGYNQDSLFEFVAKNRPPNRTQLRLMLVKELAKVPAASLPISVNISELLDVTVDYLMPEDSVNFMEGKLASKSKDMMPTVPPQVNDQTMERLQKLASMVDLQVGCPGSDERNAFESRLQGLEPVRLFIKDRMSKLARQFSITSEYVEKTASIIVKLLASCGFASLVMRRHLAAYGPVSLGELISTKIRLYEPHFPPGINAKFIITFVLDFLEDNQDL